MTKSKIVTFGCRLNSYESEVMADLSDAAGLQDTIVFNTCAVTSEAQRQARQAIRKARRENPDAKIVVTGCAAQIDPGEFADMPEVDHVIGNSEKMDRAVFDSLTLPDSERIIVNDIMSVKETANHLISGFGERARAFVQIQNGCDHRCTFCIIPYGRGNSRSVPAGVIVEQVRALVERGFKEVVLTGVDLTAYGKDLPGQMTLGSLVKSIFHQVGDLPRLRISSIDSIEVDADLLDVITNEPRLMPHLHLSLQSGDNMILKRMKRRHLREDAIAFCELVRRERPDIVFGADIIAGFPTETEDMFAQSMDLVDACELTFLHVFPYSPRPGTPAARMPQLDRSIVKQRAQRLRTLGGERLSKFLARQKDQTVELLMENSTVGRTPQFAEMQLDESQATGSIVTARIDGVTGHQLVGHSLPHVN